MDWRTPGPFPSRMDLAPLPPSHATSPAGIQVGKTLPLESLRSSDVPMHCINISNLSSREVLALVRLPRWAATRTVDADMTADAAGKPDVGTAAICTVRPELLYCTVDGCTE